MFELMIKVLKNFAVKYTMPCYGIIISRGCKMKNNDFFKLGQNGERITFNKLKEELSSKDIESNPIFTQLFSIFDKDSFIGF